MFNKGTIKNTMKVTSVTLHFLFVYNFELHLSLVANFWGSFLFCLIVVGRFVCHRDFEGYEIWWAKLLVGSTLVDRQMDSGQKITQKLPS